MLKYVEVVHSSGLHTWLLLILILLLKRLCTVVNECIPNPIIYNCNIPLLLKNFDKQHKLTKNKNTVTSPSFK